MREQQAQMHAAARARAAGNPYQAPEAIQARQAAELAALPRAIPIPVTPSVAGVLPSDVRAAAGLPVANPKLWQADVKPIPGRVDKAGWKLRVRAVPRQPLLRPATLIAVADALAWFVGRETAGIARVTYEALATAAKCCVETVRKALRALEGHGLLDTFNVLVRSEGQVRRGANVYGLRGFTAAIAGAAEAVVSAATGAFDRMGEQLRRYAAAWGLKARKWGLNATPVRTSPAPA